MKICSSFERMAAVSEREGQRSDTAAVFFLRPVGLRAPPFLSFLLPKSCQKLLLRQGGALNFHDGCGDPVGGADGLSHILPQAQACHQSADVGISGSYGVRNPGRL